MFIKVLLIIYFLIGALSIKGLFVKKDFQKHFNDEVEKDPSYKSIYTIIYLFLNIIQTIVLITFYSLAYSLTDLIGWLSVFQTVSALINLFYGFYVLNNIISGTYKRKNILNRILIIAFDLFYGVVVAMALI